MRLFLTLLFSILAFVAGFMAKAFSLPPIVAATAFVAAAAIVILGNRSRIVGEFKRWQTGQVKPGIFALMLFAGICTVFAAPNIEDTITSLVVRPSGTRTSDENGLVRLYSANESNYFAITTNLDFVFFTANGSFTGRTHSAIVTNINDSATRGTNAFKSGVLVSTNGVIPL